jgi:hypothetical protein
MNEPDGGDTGGDGASGTIEEKRRENSGGSGSALSSGLQPGGIRPGGGPGATVGSIDTGGGSNQNETTGDADRNNIDEEQL